MESQPNSPATDDTSWTKDCPHCEAKVQPVARRCWHCGAELAEPGSEHPDYMPTNGDELHAVSVTILAAIALALPVLFVAWVLSMIS